MLYIVMEVFEWQFLNIACDMAAILKADYVTVVVQFRWIWL